LGGGEEPSPPAWPGSKCFGPKRVLRPSVKGRIFNWVEMVWVGGSGQGEKVDRQGWERQLGGVGPKDVGGFKRGPSRSFRGWARGVCVTVQPKEIAVLGGERLGGAGANPCPGSRTSRRLYVRHQMVCVVAGSPSPSPTQGGGGTGQDCGRGCGVGRKS